MNWATALIGAVFAQPQVIAVHHLCHIGVRGAVCRRACRLFARGKMPLFVTHRQVGAVEPSTVKTMQRRRVGHLRIACGQKDPRGPQGAGQAGAQPGGHANEHLEWLGCEHDPLQHYEPASRQDHHAQQTGKTEKLRQPLACLRGGVGRNFLQRLH